MAGTSPANGRKYRISTLDRLLGSHYLTSYNPLFMARQTGAIPFVGRIGALSFYKDKVHGYLIRSAGGPSKEQIKKKKSMEAVRQNISEFGRASGYGALLRKAFRVLVLHCKEYSMSRRLQALLVSVIKMDKEHEPGKRELVKEHLIQLQGFELNEALSYRHFFKKDVDLEQTKKTIAVKGRCAIPKKMAKRASYYKVVSTAAAIDFEGNGFLNDVKESELLPLNVSKEFVFRHRLNGAGYLFYGLVVCFYKMNGKKPELINDADMKAGFISFIE